MVDNIFREMREFCSKLNLDKTDSEFGFQFPGNPWNLGKPHTEDTKNQISQAKLGKPSPHKGKKYSAEVRAKMSLAQKKSTANKQPKSTEHKKNISKALKGKAVSEEKRKRISESLKGNVPWNKGKTGCQVAWNKGTEHTEETKDKISKANKGKTPWNKGVPRSEETKQKIRLAKSKSEKIRT